MNLYANLNFFEFFYFFFSVLNLIRNKFIKYILKNAENKYNKLKTKHIKKNCTKLQSMVFSGNSLHLYKRNEYILNTKTKYSKKRIRKNKINI